jgi:hypothetical protein
LDTEKIFIEIYPDYVFVSCSYNGKAEEPGGFLHETRPKARKYVYRNYFENGTARPVPLKRLVRILKSAQILERHSRFWCQFDKIG